MKICSKVLNEDFTRSVPLILAPFGRSQNPKKNVFFNNNCESSWAQKFTFLMVINHAKCFCNLWSYTFQIAFFPFWAVKPISGTKVVQSSADPPIWMPKTPFMARIVKFVMKNHYKNKNWWQKNSVPQNFKNVAAWSLKKKIQKSILRQDRF